MLSFVTPFVHWGTSTFLYLFLRIHLTHPLNILRARTSEFRTSFSIFCARWSRTLEKHHQNEMSVPAMDLSVSLRERVSAVSRAQAESSRADFRSSDGRNSEDVSAE